MGVPYCIVKGKARLGQIVRRYWGGGKLGPKSLARIAKVEKAKAKEKKADV
ncbi:unnamed protein product [Soboliphyme baturini]|uniref:30S ribosomal protein S12 n=1 Tax=Soboliphyme baturini TaxID=241478 RepID=A0A183J8M6_9BILA|nr:unnamed protein product [Soboliphyme baturini]